MGGLRYSSVPPMKPTAMKAPSNSLKPSFMSTLRQVIIFTRSSALADALTSEACAEAIGLPTVRPALRSVISFCYCCCKFH